MYVLTAENMKTAEEFSHQHRGLTFYSMMRMAGEKTARYIAAREDCGAKICIMCGKGKNGGDGIVAATELNRLGFGKVIVLLIDGEVKDPLAYKMYKEALKSHLTFVDGAKNPSGMLRIIEGADVLVDAIFGIGFKGELRGNAADAVVTANLNTKAKKYAVDIPSGLSADGTVGSIHFETDVTLTMISYKPVNVIKPAANLCGRVEVFALGIQPEDVEQFAEKYTVWSQDEVTRALAKRAYNANKGSFGKQLLICGSREFTGCVYLSAQGAVEAGAGLVTVAFPESIYTTVTAKLNEPVFLPLSDDGNGHLTEKSADEIIASLDKYTVVAAGCGLGRSEAVKTLTKKLIENSKVPLILDADALNSIAGEPEILKNAKCDVLITPHPGEMSRLTGKTIDEIESDRLGTAIDFAKRYGVTVLLKGANSVIASPDGKASLNPTGNPGMARGGSGDVLTGVIAALAAQTPDLRAAAAIGAFAHGKAADITAAEGGMLSATPSRVIQNLSRALA